MTSSEIEFQIESNLNDFYYSWGDHSLVTCDEDNNVCILKNRTHKWPNIIVNKNIKNPIFNLIIESIKNAIEKERQPYYWLVNFNLIKDNVAEIRKAKFQPIKKWVGMYLSRERVFCITPINNYEIKKISDIEELRAWVNLVNISNFRGEEVLDITLFKSKLGDSKFHFYIGIYNNVVVNTILIFNDGLTTGLYYISTKKEYRGKGFASSIIKTVINVSVKKNDTNFVLHATQLGLNLYKKLKFEVYNQFAIFVKK